MIIIMIFLNITTYYYKYNLILEKYRILKEEKEIAFLSCV